MIKNCVLDMKTKKKKICSFFCDTDRMYATHESNKKLLALSLLNYCGLKKYAYYTNLHTLPSSTHPSHCLTFHNKKKLLQHSFSSSHFHELLIWLCSLRSIFFLHGTCEKKSLLILGLPPLSFVFLKYAVYKKEKAIDSLTSSLVYNWSH